MPAGWLGAKASDCNTGEQGSSPASGWPIQSGDVEPGCLKGPMVILIKVLSLAHLCVSGRGSVVRASQRLASHG